MLKKIISVWLVFLGLILPAPTFASYLYFSPKEINTSPDSSFDLQIRLNTLKDSINSASISLNYPTDLLSVSGINYDSSALGIPIDSQTNNGLISITRGSFATVNGDVNIGTITFKPQKSGTTQLTFSSSSKVPRLLDFTDSLDLSQNGIETITISSPISSASTNSSCQTKETFVKTNSKKILDAGQNILNSIDRISQSVLSYSTSKTGANYQLKITNIQLQKTSAQQNLKAAQNDLSSYSCNNSNAKSQLAQFKKDVGLLKLSLKNYRQAVKDLIGVILTK